MGPCLILKATLLLGITFWDGGCAEEIAALSITLFYFFVWDTVFLCISDWLWTHYAPQTALELPAVLLCQPPSARITEVEQLCSEGYLNCSWGSIVISWESYFEEKSVLRRTLFEEHCCEENNVIKKQKHVFCGNNVIGKDTLRECLSEVWSEVWCPEGNSAGALLKESLF